MHVQLLHVTNHYITTRYSAHITLAVTMYNITMSHDLLPALLYLLVPAYNHIYAFLCCTYQAPKPLILYYARLMFLLTAALHVPNG